VLSTKTPPPPIIEINRLSFDWHSWSRPVVDFNASGVVIHLVVGSTVDTASSGPVQGLHGQLNFPSISLGNSTIPEILQAIPPPPTREGLYPRMGIVNITNVNITVYGYPSVNSHMINRDTIESEEDIEMNSSPLTRMWSIHIPDEVFVPLLYATQGKLVF
jgi:hypothetical protein